MNSSGLLSNNKIYINGVSVGPLTAVVGGDSVAPGFATNLKLCDWNNGGYYANLQYGNVMTYSRELTPSEILQKKYNQEYIRISIRDEPFDAEKLYNILETQNILDTIKKYISQNKKVLIHCNMGQQRSCAKHLKSYVANGFSVT
jgi:hypothetical protein